jgi:hypothetical protein
MVRGVRGVVRVAPLASGDERFQGVEQVEVGAGIEVGGGDGGGGVEHGNDGGAAKLCREPGRDLVGDVNNLTAAGGGDGEVGHWVYPSAQRAGAIIGHMMAVLCPRGNGGGPQRWQPLERGGVGSGVGLAAGSGAAAGVADGGGLGQGVPVGSGAGVNAGRNGREVAADTGAGVGAGVAWRVSEARGMRLTGEAQPKATPADPAMNRTASMVVMRFITPRVAIMPAYRANG